MQNEEQVLKPTTEPPAKPADNDEYVAPRTKGQWKWSNNPHKDRTDGFK